MSKAMKIALAVSGFLAVAVVIGTPLLQAHATTPDYLITATDTIPVFQAGAASLKDNGFAVLNVAVPWLAGALIALTIVYLFYAVFRKMRA